MNEKVKYPTKKYFHIDRKIKYSDKIKSHVESPDWVSRHGFLPFLKFTKTSTKFKGHNKQVKRKKKERPIMYASHIDSFIYMHYGEKISKYYNKWTNCHGIDDCSIAYRNNKPGESNIQFAAEVIRTIIKYKYCYIFVSDFKKFFDSLNHKYLKQCLKEVLDVKTLTKDYYQVLKSLTHSSYIEVNELKNWLKERNIDFKAQQCYFKDIKEFREFAKTSGLVHRYSECECEDTSIDHKIMGIPQGSAMSGLLANIYMIHADEAINKIVKQHHGLYRRYSDDFIVVIPHCKCTSDEFETIRQQIEKKLNDCHVELQHDKTERYSYDNGTIRYIDSNNDNNKNPALDYLGFRFDGKTVSARQRSVYKFYRKADRCIYQAQKHSIRNNSIKLSKISKIKQLFTDKSKNKHMPYGNFIDYMKRAQREFETIEGIECKIMEQIKHRGKIMRKFKRSRKIVSKLHIGTLEY